MDPYLYPGTNTLRNLPGLRDPDELEAFESTATSLRLAKLRRQPVKGRFDIVHLRAIHKYIFQDVFDWAGQFRTVNISKGGTMFGPVIFLESTLGHILDKLAREKHLAGLDDDAFVTGAAWYLGELNAIHPFREGNGRTQREFIRTLALHAKRRIEWSRTDRATMTEASIASSRRGDIAGFAAILRACPAP